MAAHPGVRAREATCSCGRLRLTVEGEPVRVSICHCLACQRRTGSAFGYQARFDAAGVRIEGSPRRYVRISDHGEERTFHFCGDCGSTLYYTSAAEPSLVAFAVGAFADPAFPTPRVSVWESRRHSWVGLPEGIRHERQPG